MYNEENKFTSDLINSYAWDTAIIFLLWDMASNNSEWTTETNGGSSVTSHGPCVYRGGIAAYENDYYYTSNRSIAETYNVSGNDTFRVVLYL